MDNGNGTTAYRAKLFAVLSTNSEYASSLLKMLELEGKDALAGMFILRSSPSGHGFLSTDLEGVPVEHVDRLRNLGIIKPFWTTGSMIAYAITNADIVKEVITAFLETIKEIAKVASDAEPPADMFGYIIGHDDIKELFQKSLASKKPFNILMIGPPACAKSIFLLEVSRLAGSIYTLGSSSSKAGLADYLITNTPKYLIVDELDKMSRDDFGVLLSATETGIVTETKYNKTRRAELKLWCYAAANDVFRIPSEVLSRFEVLYFQPYTEKEFNETGVGVLTQREGTNRELAEYITRKVWSELGEEKRDIREVVRLSHISHTKEELDRNISIIKKRQRTLP